MNDSASNGKIVEFAASDLAKSDAALVKRCRRGDQTAWDELVDRYQRLIYAIPRRAGLSEEQASDVFQEVFLTLVEKIDEIQQPDKIRSWMVTTAKFKTWGLIRGSKGLHSPDTTEEMENEMASIADESPLADDLLIHVTGFFRDAPAWAAMREKVIVPLVEPITRMTMVMSLALSMVSSTTSPN